MKSLKTASLILILLSVAGLSARAEDNSLETALRQSNRGDTDQAIQTLKGLEQSNPGDAQISRTLGLLYQSTDQHDLAIEELEKSVGLAPSPEAEYALGMLYEAKWVGTKTPTWKEKAMTAWKEFLAQTPKDHARRSVAERHLEKLQKDAL